MSDKLSSKLGKLILYSQLIEESLKQYISKVFEKIRIDMGEKITFELDDAYLQNKSIASVLNVFKKLNNNGELINKLWKSREIRNIYIHEKFKFIVSSNDEQDGKQKFINIEETIDEDLDFMKEVFEMLLEEKEKI